MSAIKAVCCMYAALSLLCAAPGPAGAKEETMGKVKIGAMEVFILSDGDRDLDAKLFLATDPDRRAAVEKIYPDGAAHNTLNVFLIKSGHRLILVDAGGGTVLGPNPGKLPEGLAQAGFAPADITDVILTHAHRDHLGGLGPGGRQAFPQAVVHLAKPEYDFWMNPENEAKAPERARPNFAIVRDMLNLYPGRVQTFEPGAELFPGIATLPAYGHTPGHVAVLVGSQGQHLLIWGDLLHGLDLQLARPDMAIAFDIDPDLAVKSRQGLLARAAKEKWLVSGAHVPGPKAYRIEAQGKGYVLVP